MYVHVRHKTSQQPRLCDKATNYGTAAQTSSSVSKHSYSRHDVHNHTKSPRSKCLAFAHSFLYDVLAPTDDDRAVRVMHDVITDAAHHRASQLAHAARAHDDHHGVVLLGRLADHLSWLAAKQRQDLAAHLPSRQCVTSHTYYSWMMKHPTMPYRD